MTQEVFDLLSQCIVGKNKDDYVLPEAAKRSKIFVAHGGPCAKAGLGKFVKDEDDKLEWQGLLFHDLRRSAVRNLEGTRTVPRVWRDTVFRATRGNHKANLRMGG